MRRTCEMQTVILLSVMYILSSCVFIWVYMHMSTYMYVYNTNVP